jgi:hypothetical protein
MEGSTHLICIRKFRSLFTALSVTQTTDSTGRIAVHIELLRMWKEVGMASFKVEFLAFDEA